MKHYIFFIFKLVERWNVLIYVSTFAYYRHNRNFHKVAPFGSFCHPPTFLSTFKHCYPPSNEILLNMHMKCWNLILNPWALKIFTILKHTTIAMISLKKLREKSRVKFKFGVNLNFSPYLGIKKYFIVLLEISPPLWPNKGPSLGVLVLCFLYFVDISNVCKSRFEHKFDQPISNVLVT